jgi:hypothetical protein
MQYLLLIYNNEKNWTELPDADAGALMGDYQSFTESIAKSGHYKGGNALQPTNTATTVRVRNGKHTATDGPSPKRANSSAATISSTKDLDEAIGIAARIPGALTGAIEVQPDHTRLLPQFRRERREHSGDDRACVSRGVGSSARNASASSATSMPPRRRCRMRSRSR